MEKLILKGTCYSRHSCSLSIQDFCPNCTPKWLGHMEISPKRCFKLAGHAKSLDVMPANEAGSWRGFIRPN